MTINADGGVFSGIVESGDYGSSSTIKDRKSSQLKYNKTKDDLDIKPFYFLLWFPKAGQIGYLILQRTGVYGINGIFSQILSKFISSKFEDTITETGRYVSKELAKKYLNNGDVKEILLTLYDLPPDIIDNLMGPNNKLYNSDVLSVQIKITAKDKFGFLKPDKLTKENKFINDKDARLFDTPLLDKLGMDGAHKEKLRIKLGKSDRIVDLGDSFELRPYFDIDDDIETNSANGHPIFESIDKVANKFIKDIENEVL